MTTVTLELDIPEDVQRDDVTRSVTRWLKASGVDVREAQPLQECPVDTVAGLELSDPMPKGWTPLEAIVGITCLVAEPGTGPPVRVHWSPTAGLPSHEAAGILDFIGYQIQLCWGSWIVVADGPDDDDKLSD
jgi:hypothetical protein